MEGYKLILTILHLLENFESYNKLITLIFFFIIQQKVESM